MPSGAHADSYLHVWGFRPAGASSTAPGGGGAHGPGGMPLGGGDSEGTRTPCHYIYYMITHWC